MLLQDPVCPGNDEHVKCVVDSLFLGFLCWILTGNSSSASALFISISSLPMIYLVIRSVQ